MNEKLYKIIEKCKCEFSLTINEHRNYNQNVKEYIESSYPSLDDEDISKEVLEKMIEKDTIIEIYLYPDTPIGFYQIFHYDLDTAINLTYETLFPNENN